MRKNITITIILICTFSCVSGQEIRARVIDSITKESIPFASVIYKKRGTITNEEGRFTFIYGKSTKSSDTLMISCIGFKTIAKPLEQYKDSVLLMSPQTNELKRVVLTNKNYTADEIIDKVKENINKNYTKDLTKKRLFFRESNHQRLIKTNFKLKKSTIKELNKKFLDSAINSIPPTNSYYSEILCDLYGNFNQEKQKIDLIKASEMYDKNNQIGLTALEEKFNNIIKKNVKKDSYFKVKSGWFFGQKVKMDDFVGKDVDSTDAEALKKQVEDQKKREADRKKNFAKYRKNRITHLMQSLFFQDDTKLNFIRKSGRYDFELKDITYMGETPVYVLTFEPGWRAEYRGTLYVNIDDFAVVRADYENTESVKSFKLLGVSFNQYLSKGKMIFDKTANGKYGLKYLEQENASRFGVKRPLKIIEKNKNVRGRRKQNELSVKLDLAMGNTDKREIVVFDTDEISSAEYTSFKEKNTVTPTYMASYDPDFWKGYNIIEPNKAIREYTVVE